MTEPRLYAVPLSAAFPSAFAEGFFARFGHLAPDEIAHIRIFANTRRMASAIADALAARGPVLLPRLLTFADLARSAPDLPIPPAADPLALRLELSQLVRRLLQGDPTIAPPDAAFDISDTLVRLLGEMAGEGVGIERLRGIDLSNHSAYWARSLRFIELVAAYLDGDHASLEAEARQRAVVEAVIDRWASDPPPHPMIIAGSTGSRGTTRRLMEAVARLDNGHVVLPGLDTFLPKTVWGRLGEGHPQFRFASLMEALGLPPDAVEIWAGTPRDPGRARVLSLALRPPPVTNQWREEGARLPDLARSLSSVTLVEAPGERAEAVAIAMGLREAVERGQRAALITPDRVLTRRVTAALTRWGIEPDDSAGRPLALSAPGRLLRQIASMTVTAPEAGDVLSLLKHPLVSTGSDRASHLLFVRDFELCLRKAGHPFRGGPTFEAFAEARPEHGHPATWAASLIDPLPPTPGSLGSWLSRVVSDAEALVRGPQAGAPDELWSGKAGEAARQAVDSLMAVAENAGPVTPGDALRILEGALQDEVREPVLPHSDVMIRGTIEVRALEADVVILAGLNEDIWPPAPEPDPWLNRSLRREAGLLSPERRTGLSAHDFEMAFNSPEIWLTRTLRGAEGETVPSRWLNRLCGLIGGLDKGALAAMRSRGDHWLALADGIDRRMPPVPPAHRPAPRPPVEKRPRQISVTEVQKLIRDPYAVYAQRVLGLAALPPPVRTADARLRGNALHEIAERFVRGGLTGDPAADRASLAAVTETVLSRHVPWAVTRRLWAARLDRIAGSFLFYEYERRQAGAPIAFEVGGRLEFAEPAITLTGTADRIDSRPDGLAVWDYKSGKIPTEKQVLHYDRQLLLEAIMAEAGAFDGVDAERVIEVGHIGLGSDPIPRCYRFDGTGSHDFDIDTVSAEFTRLMAAYFDPRQGYSARRAMEKMSYDGDYDHLARFGEWDDTATPLPEDLG